MKTFLQILQTLGHWKWHYGSAAVLLLMTTFFRMLEPKVLQLTVDVLMKFLAKTPGAQNKGNSDFFADWLYSFLPELNSGNLGSILLILAFIFLLVSLFRASVSFGAGALSALASESAIKNLRDRLFAHLQHLPLNYFHRNKTGEIIQRCSGDMDTVKRLLESQLIELLRMAGIFGFAFYMMASIHLTYALVAICLAPLIGTTALFFFKYESKVWDEHEKEQDKLTALASENIGGIRVVKAFAAEQFEIDQFTRQNHKKFKIGLKHVDLHANFWTFSDFLIHLQISLSVLVGGYFALNGAITVGELAAFFTYSIMVAWPLRQVGRIVSQMGMALVAMLRINEILNKEPEDYNGLKPDYPLNGDIEFINVTFTYPGQKVPALNKLSFRLNAGERLGIIGPSGAGKSTIIALLCRIYEADEGQILIDGKPVEQYSRQYLRTQIGVVMQQAFLFSTTVKNNISYAGDDIRFEDIETVTEMAQATQILQKLPSGYNTMVGEKGVTLSGGQKQRISLARTLLEEASILILDDATSAVDTATESKIHLALENHLQKRTTLVIAHRATSIQGVDKVLTLIGGKRTEFGTPAELIDQDGFYAEMLNVQKNIEAQIV